MTERSEAKSAKGSFASKKKLTLRFFSFASLSHFLAKFKMTNNWSSSPQGLKQAQDILESVQKCQRPDLTRFQVVRVSLEYGACFPDL